MGNGIPVRTHTHTHTHINDRLLDYSFIFFPAFQITQYPFVRMSRPQCGERAFGCFRLISAKLSQRVVVVVVVVVLRFDPLMATERFSL